MTTVSSKNTCHTSAPHSTRLLLTQDKGWTFQQSLTNLPTEFYHKKCNKIFFLLTLPDPYWSESQYKSAPEKPISSAIWILPESLFLIYLFSLLFQLMYLSVSCKPFLHAAAGGPSIPSHLYLLPFCLLGFSNVSSKWFAIPPKRVSLSQLKQLHQHLYVPDIWKLAK